MCLLYSKTISRPHKPDDRLARVSLSPLLIRRNHQADLPQLRDPMAYYPPSPPSSTSLPSHFTYPLYSSDPPPTDGPNTREKLRMGLLPRSGRVGPPLAPRKEDEGYDWQGLEEGEGEGDRSWDSQGTVGDQENVSFYFGVSRSF